MLRGGNRRRVLLATTNPGKLREIERVLDGLRFDFLSLQSFDVAAPDETGQTFEENARQKAEYYAGVTGVATVAEDSGLTIDVLDGRPGVESARYPGRTYAEKFANLYRELAAHQVDRKQAIAQIG